MSDPLMLVDLARDPVMQQLSQQIREYTRLEDTAAALEGIERALRATRQELRQEVERLWAAFNAIQQALGREPQQALGRERPQ